MALFGSEAKLLSFSSILLLLLLNAYTSLLQHGGSKSDEDPKNSPHSFNPIGDGSIVDADQIAAVVLHNFRLCIMFNLLDEDLGFWVKPRSKIWFN